MAQKTIRFTNLLLRGINTESKKRGYSSPAAFIRAAIENELNGRAESAPAYRIEDRIAASLDRLGQELRRFSTAQQAHFALTDALARVILLCVPEPPVEVHAHALASAKERHQKFLKMAALSMRGDARAA